MFGNKKYIMLLSSVILLFFVFLLMNNTKKNSVTNPINNTGEQIAKLNVNNVVNQILKVTRLKKIEEQTGKQEIDTFSCGISTVCPWQQEKTLSTEEILQFDQNVVQSIKRMSTWGKLSDELFGNLVKNMEELGNRGLAYCASSISLLNEGSNLSQEQSEKVLEYLDTLSILAKHGHPAAREYVKHLALLKLEFDRKGHVSESMPLRGYITSEMFQALSASDPEVASTFIQLIPEKTQKYFYVYHYVIGRKLAGQDQELAVSEARTKFSEEVVKQVGAWN